MRKLVAIVAILGTSSCSTCWTPPGAGIRSGSNTVGFGDRAGAPNYYCQPGVCQSTGIHDPDYRMCLGGYKNPAADLAPAMPLRDGGIAAPCRRADVTRPPDGA